MKSLELLRNYLDHPLEYWPAGGRQATKLESRLARIQKVLKTDRSGAIDEVVMAARFRGRFAPPTVYIDSIGSSGSHWLQAMLGELFPALNCGEVYLPAPMFEAIKALPVGERRTVIQGV